MENGESGANSTTPSVGAIPPAVMAAAPEPGLVCICRPKHQPSPPLAVNVGDKMTRSPNRNGMERKAAEGRDGGPMVGGLAVAASSGAASAM